VATHTSETNKIQGKLKGSAARAIEHTGTHTQAQGKVKPAVAVKHTTNATPVGENRERREGESEKPQRAVRESRNETMQWTVIQSSQHATTYGMVVPSHTGSPTIPATSTIAGI
jgi:hypothetical protein